MFTWILNFVEKEIASTLLFSDSAMVPWGDLEERFEQQSYPKIFQVRYDIINLKQNSNTLVEYYNKLKVLWIELESTTRTVTCACGLVCKCGAFKETEN